MPFAAPVIAPPSVKLTSATFPPEDVKSIASPLVVVMLPWPVISNVPPVDELPVIVPVKLLA